MPSKQLSSEKEINKLQVQTRLFESDQHKKELACNVPNRDKCMMV
jgi:hypothetical protein